MSRILRSPWTLVAVALITSSGILAARRLAGDFLATQQPALIPQPSIWQPFHAEVLQTHKDFPDLIGQFYRSSDGSERYDLAARDGSDAATTIVSFRTGWQYSCRIDTKWCQRRPTGAGPVRRLVQRRIDMPNLAVTDQEIEGFQVYEYTDPGGVTSLQAPALNFATLVHEDAKSGFRRVLFNIRLEEPPASLFDTPSGFEIRDETPRKR